MLTRHHIEAPRTHDLRRLIQLAAPFAAALVALADRADALSVHGVQTRYPDDLRVIDQTEMREMMQLADEFADVLLPLLPEA